MPQAMVVDDETTMREMLYDVLSRRGYDVLAVNSGPQALDVLKTQRPQLILMDVGMPGMSGLEVVKTIRTFDDEVPILLMRGTGDPEVSPDELKRLAITDVLRKELGVELFVKGLDASLKQLQHRPRVPGVQGAAHVPGTLLIVDDDDKVQQLLKRFFESRGLRVFIAGSGEEALMAIKQKPLAVLLDVNMMGMDGLMTLKKIKAIQPDLPVIMASGVGEEPTVREALEAGAYDYVMKPFNLEYLETVVLTKILLGMEG